MRKMFWIDLEMTGLDEKVDCILEVAVAITDLDLNVLETFHRIVKQPQTVLEQMNEWCKNMHGKSGLSAKVPFGTPLEVVEKEMIELATKYYPLPINPKASEEKIVLCGNSVSNDQRFIWKYMPEFSKRLHYRLVDVTSFKEIFRSKYGVNVQKKDAHRAVDDILESVAELKVYLGYISATPKASA